MVGSSSGRSWLHQREEEDERRGNEWTRSERGRDKAEEDDWAQYVAQREAKDCARSNEAHATGASFGRSTGSNHYP